MKKVTFSVMFLLNLCTSGFGGSPKLFISEQDRSYDFGEVGIGQELKHIFKIENRGTEKLVISDISSSCGCTVAILGNDTIVPGGMGTIKVKYSTRRATGAQNELVTLVSNDPNRRIYRLAISVMAISDFDYEPDRISFKTPKCAASEHTVTLTSLSLISEVRVVKVETSNPEFMEAIIHEGLDFADRRFSRITLMWKPGHPIGKVEERITIHTTSEISPVITIPIEGEVTGNFRILPSNIHFGVLRKGAKKEKTVRVEFLGLEEDKITNVTSSKVDNTLSWTVEKRSDSMNKSNIKIVMQPHKIGRYDNELIVQTNLKDQPKIYIPIGAYVME